jgi:hypothetical protein
VAGWDDEARERLRAAVNRGRGREGLDLLAVRPLAPVLQLAGDVLLAALRDRVPGAEAHARACADALNERGREGDAELAAELTAALDGTRTALIEAPVDLGVLGERLAAAPSEGVQVLDLRTGDIDDPGHPEFDPESEEFDVERWLTFVPEGRRGEEDQRRGRARHWLASQGYKPGPRPFL